MQKNKHSDKVLGGVRYIIDMESNLAEYIESLSKVHAL